MWVGWCVLKKAARLGIDPNNLRVGAYPDDEPPPEEVSLLEKGEETTVQTPTADDLRRLAPSASDFGALIWRPDD